MYVAGGGGAAGHFVGLNPAAVTALAAALASTGGAITAASARVAGLLAEAGPDAGGATAPDTLRRIDAWLDTARADLRWRAAVLEADGAASAGGMVIGWLAFA